MKESFAFLEAGTRPKGWILSKTTALFLLVVIAISLIVVGVSVHYGTRSRQQTICDAEKDALRGGSKQTTNAIITTGTSKDMISTTSSEITTTPTPIPPIYRLPTHVKPVLYTIHLKPDFYGTNKENFTFEGSTDILLECVNSTKEVVFNIKDIEILNDISLLKSDRTEIDINEIIKDPLGETWSLQLDEVLVPGDNYTLRFSNFTAPLDGDLAGLYLSSYQEKNETRYMATTQMQASDARRAFPCWDEPNFRSLFKISVSRKDKYTAVSNMPLDKTERTKDGWHTDHFKVTKDMPTYLVAIIVSDFKNRSDETDKGVKFSILSRESEINRTSYALRCGISGLDKFEAYFNVSYPLRKQDMAAIPDFAAGAMENWGLITYRETRLLYDEEETRAYDQFQLYVTIVHELAHQWFGNLVTPKWWDDLWLNEGFATFMEYVALRDLEKEWKVESLFLVFDRFRAMSLDGLTTSHPIYLKLEKPSEIASVFDAISYAKGASILQMMESYIGPKVFQKGLTNYLKKFSYGNAFHDDLYEAWQTACSCTKDIKQFMDTWTLQMSYPIVTFFQNATTSLVSVKQERYLATGLNTTDESEYSKNNTYGYKWVIPITIIDSTRNETSLFHDVLLHNQTAKELTYTVSKGKDNWFIGNYGAKSFYRVNYETQMWNRIIEVLKENYTTIDERNRAQLIQDAFALVGVVPEVNISMALDLSNYLKKETEYTPLSSWTIAFNKISSMYKTHSIYGSIRKYYAAITENSYSKLQWNPISNTNIPKRLLQEMMIGFSCQRIGHENCTTEAEKKFNNWKKLNTPIEPDFRSTVFCTGVHKGGEEAWNFMFDKYMDEKNAEKQKQYRQSLACSSQIWLLARWLEKSMDEDIIRSQDFTSVISSVASRISGRELVWKFFNTNWKVIKARFDRSSFIMSNLLKAIISNYHDEYDKKMILTWREKAGNLGSGEQAFSQAMEDLEVRIQWKKQHGKEFVDWMTSNFS